MLCVLFNLLLLLLHLSMCEQEQSRIVADRPSEANHKEYRDRFESLLQLADGRMPRDFLFEHCPAVLLDPSFKDIITARREAIKPAAGSSSSSGGSAAAQQPTEPQGEVQLSADSFLDAEKAAAELKQVLEQPDASDDKDFAVHMVLEPATNNLNSRERLVALFSRFQQMQTNEMTQSYTTVADINTLRVQQKRVLRVVSGSATQ